MSEKITNARLSQLSGITLTKIKRFARDFLGSDPQAMRYDGVARKYSVEDAFVVFLGAKLVSELKFTTKEAVRIIAVLKPWLISRGMFLDSRKDVEGVESRVESYEIEVCMGSTGAFNCIARGYVAEKVLASDSAYPAGYPGGDLYIDKYIMIPIGNCNLQAENEHLLRRRLPVTRLCRAFQVLMEGRGLSHGEGSHHHDALPQTRM
jgi:hypothetical protein